jgi:PLD-like domain
VGGKTEGALISLARGVLMERIAGAKRRILLASPFLTLPIAEEISKKVTAPNDKDLRLLTALEPRSVRAGVLDPKAVALLKTSGFRVSHRTNLHAKVSLVDSWGLVGSGNLTGKGLGVSDGGGNYELGVVLSAAQRRHAARIFNGWWKKAKPASDKELAWLDKLERFERDPKDNRGPAFPVFDVEDLKLALAEDKPERRYWADANYHSRTNEAWWLDRKWISGPRYVHYNENDLIAIYLGAKNRGPKRCPAIVRARTNTELNEKHVAKHREDAETASRWPNVTWIETLGEASPVSEGVPLELIEKTGRSLQRGSCELTRDQFETLADAMIAAAERS